MAYVGVAAVGVAYSPAVLISSVTASLFPVSCCLWMSAGVALLLLGLPSHRAPPANSSLPPAWSGLPPVSPRADEGQLDASCVTLLLGAPRCHARKRLSPVPPAPTSYLGKFKRKGPQIIKTI